MEKERWTKVALARMNNVDSFLKESERVFGSFFRVVRMALMIWPVRLVRKTMNTMFTDGTFIPKGTLVCIGIDGAHFDDRLYENARVFEPFRSVDTDKAGGEGDKHLFVSTGIDYLAFGHDKHAWYVMSFSSLNELITQHTPLLTEILQDAAQAERANRRNTILLYVLT